MTVFTGLFGQSFLNDPARAKERDFWCRQIAAGDRIGTTRAVTGAIDRSGIFEKLADIVTPTLVFVGEEDVATPPDRTIRMQRAIPGSKLVHIPRSGHSATLEEPEVVNAAIKEFLATIDS